MSNAIATTIAQQLGGNKFIAMTGASFMADGNTLIVKFKGSRIANIMYVTLNSMDLYDVKICKYRGLNVKVIKEVEGAYNDMLCPIFEQTTGLRTKLF
jgi:formate-dependent phosphoribosylglycinamide formyltransferase (GAR transformylase)